MPDERDHRRLRTPPKGVQAQIAQPESWDEEITASHSGDEIELKRKRAMRPTDKRIERLEEKDDKQAAEIEGLKTAVNSLEVAVSGMNGQMKVWPQLVEKLEKAVDRSLEQRHQTFTATLEVDKASAASGLKIKETADLAAIADKTAANAFKREITGRALALIFTGITALAGLIAAAYAVGTRAG